MFKVVIDRKKWGRGDGEGYGSLLDPNTHKMCCLGFACRAVGAKPKELRNLSYPSDLYETWNEETYNYERSFPKEFKGLSGKKLNDSQICRLLALANDNGKITDAVREKRIKTLGKKARINFTFVN